MQQDLLIRLSSWKTLWEICTLSENRTILVRSNLQSFTRMLNCGGAVTLELRAFARSLNGKFTRFCTLKNARSFWMLISSCFFEFE